MKRSITRILISLGILCMISMIFVGAFAEDTLSISSPGDWELFSWNHAINIKWNSISGAVGYHVSVRNMTTDTLVLNREWVTGTKLDISDYIPASPGKYKVWVGAVEEKGGASPTSWQDYIKIYIAREPDITNGSASTITDDGAVLHMSVDKDYGYEITDCGFYIGTSSTKSQMTKYSFKNYSTSQGATTKGEKSMTVTGLQTGKKYYYRAYAVNEVGEDYSTPGYFTTGGTSNQLDKPVITYPASNATYEASKSIKLQWNAVSDVDGYRYYIKQLSGQPDPTNDDEPCVEEWPGSTSSSRRYYTLSASKVRAGYWYKFVVEAYAEGAKSGWSDWCYVYIGKGALTKPVVTSLTNWSEVNAGSSIVVDWDDVAAAGGYRCHIKQLSGQPDTSDTNEPAVKTWREICGTTSKYTLSAGNVVGGYWYKIVVEAYDGGESTWSDWYYVYAVEGGQLDRPVITSPVAGDNFETGKSISFTWSKVTNAEGYNYFIKELTGEPNYSDNESASRSWTGSTSSTSRRFTLDGDYLQPDTWYKFVVEAKTEGWESGWSRYTYIKIPDRVDWIHYVLPAALTEIPEESFANNSQLRTFDASDSNLISIGSKAFANCTNLLSINLPDTVEFIAEDAFSGCSSVKFHCVSGSYAEEYANRKGISVEKHGIAIESDMIQVSQSTWQPSSAAAQLGIVITSSGNWTASKSSNSSWLTVSSTSGSSGERITFNATKNTKASPRSATVTFMCGDATATVEIEQGKATASWGGGSTTPVVSGSWTDPETIYVTLGDSYQLNGSISVSNGTLGVVSVSVYGGANQALTHNYSAAANNEITTSAINLQYQSDFRINTGFDTSFKEAGTYQLTMYAKADGSNDAVKIGSKTLVVEPVDTLAHVALSDFDNAFTNGSWVEQYILQKECMYMSYDIYENTVTEDFLRLGITAKEVNKNKSSIGQHKVGYAIGQKRLSSGKILYVVVIRGTYDGYNMNEWISNFDIQKNGDAYGFVQAANEVANAIKAQYIDKDNCKILFTGHSRGAAVANYLAGYWARSFGIAADDIYAYTFACPNVVSKNKQPRYTGGGIHNYNLIGDPVTKVPFDEKWSFTRYGLTREYNIPVLNKHMGVSLVDYRMTIDFMDLLQTIDRQYYCDKIFPFITDVFLYIDGEINIAYLTKRGIEFLADMAENHPEVYIRLNDYCERYNLKGDKLIFSDDSTINRFVAVFKKMANTHLQSTYLNAVSADYWGLRKK